MLEGQTFEPAGRLAQFMRMIEAFERNEIETAVDALIAHLDATDGDPDLEDDTEDCGMEECGEAGSWAEDHLGITVGHPYPDDAHEDDCPAARRHHLARIRRTSCHKTLYRGPGGLPFPTYRLRSAAE